MKINVPYTKSLPGQRKIRMKTYSIALYNDHVEKVLDFTADEARDESTEEDEALADELRKWDKDVVTYDIASIKKECLVGVDLSRMKDSWRVGLITTTNTTWLWFIPRKVQAIEFYNMLYRYVFLNELPTDNEIQYLELL
jgi:hypothetical protein